MTNRELAADFLTRVTGRTPLEAHVDELEAMLDATTEDGRETSEWERLEPTVVSAVQPQVMA
jgi:hypothetical protein